MTIAEELKSRNFSEFSQCLFPKCSANTQCLLGIYGQWSVVFRSYPQFIRRDPVGKPGTGLFSGLRCRTISSDKGPVDKGAWSRRDRLIFPITVSLSHSIYLILTGLFQAWNHMHPALYSSRYRQPASRLSHHPLEYSMLVGFPRSKPFHHRPFTDKASDYAV